MPQILMGWICTLFVAGLVAAGFTAWGVFTPNKIASQAAVPIVSTLNANTATMIQGLSRTSAAANGTSLDASVAVGPRTDKLSACGADSHAAVVHVVSHALKSLKARGSISTRFASELCVSFSNACLAIVCSFLKRRMSHLSYPKA
jgi:hypothetical protein